ncbi:acyl carrier protein [Kitasatospora sp. NPDC097643]|uniref:acyl carrier protein n=1 Tax=Kitasatospora sp. NPDC097643 TaxID=3157230 RepID=UPI00332FAD06
MTDSAAAVPARSGDLVLDFLMARRPDLGVIDPDYDLIDNRVLDSLGFVNFLYVLEEQTGREISLDQVSPEDFRTLRRIRERFFDAEQ